MLHKSLIIFMITILKKNEDSIIIIKRVLKGEIEQTDMFFVLCFLHIKKKY